MLVVRFIKKVHKWESLRIEIHQPSNLKTLFDFQNVWKDMGLKSPCGGFVCSVNDCIECSMNVAIATEISLKFIDGYEDLHIYSIHKITFIQVL